MPKPMLTPEDLAETELLSFTDAILNIMCPVSDDGERDWEHECGSDELGEIMSTLGYYSLIP